MSVGFVIGSSRDLTSEQWEFVRMQGPASKDGGAVREFVDKFQERFGASVAVAVMAGILSKVRRRRTGQCSRSTRRGNRGFHNRPGHHRFLRALVP